MVRRCVLLLLPEDCPAFEPPAHQACVLHQPATERGSKLNCGSCREDSDPRFINNAADVKLRSFTTKVGEL